MSARPQDAEGLNVVNPSENNGETMAATVRERLRQRYAAPNQALAALLGSEFETWEDRRGARRAPSAATPRLR